MKMFFFLVVLFAGIWILESLFYILKAFTSCFAHLFGFESFEPAAVDISEKKEKPQPQRKRVVRNYNRNYNTDMMCDMEQPDSMITDPPSFSHIKDPEAQSLIFPDNKDIVDVELPPEDHYNPPPYDKWANFDLENFDATNYDAQVPFGMDQFDGM